MWPLRRFSFMVRLWLRRVYTDFGIRWRRVRRPARPRAGRRPPLGVERLETIEAANNLLPLFGAMASTALVAATPAACDTGTWTIAAPVDDSAEVLDSTNTTLAQRTDEATVAADQIFLAMTDDTAAAFSQPLAPVNTDPLAQQPDDGLTGDPANPPTGGNGAFARPLSGANGQGQAAQGSSGLTNTPHMPTVNANAPSGAPAPLATAPSGPAGLIGGTSSSSTAGTTTNTTSASTASPATTSGAVPAGHGHGSSPQGGIVALDSLQPEPTVQFTQTSFITPEGAQTLLTVDLSASSTQTVTVQYATANGTAQAGVDYTNTSGTLTFDPGTTTQTITVPGLDEGGSGEVGETFTVALSSPTNATLGSANMAMVSITEDSEGGSEPTVQFQQPSYNYAEGAQATVGVSLSAASSQAVTVKYTTADNTALAGTDYTTTSGYLTFNPGTTDESITVPLLDDGGSGESGENFSVSLYSAVNATLGTPSTIPVNITEDSEGGGGAPVANNDAYSFVHDATASVSAATGVLANDSGGPPLSAVLYEPPDHGTLSLHSDGSFTYAPNAGYVGTDAFGYRASDGTQYSNVATVSLTITDANAPVAVADSYSVLHDQVLNVDGSGGVLANDSDADNDALTAALVLGQNPAHGSLTFNKDGSFVYTPDAGYVGSDSFQYTASDGALSSAATTVTLSVTDQAPVVQGHSYGVHENTPLTMTAPGLLSGASDADGDALTASLVPNQGPQHGTVTVNSDGSFTYTPTSNYTGTDSFQYKASDGVLSSAATTVTLTVSGSPPVANDDAFNVLENTTLTAPSGALTGNDYDPDNLPFTSSVATGPAHGNVTVNSDGSFSYTPTTGYTGTDSFTYTDSDGSLVSSPATVNITVETSNTAPVANDISYTLDENTSLSTDATSGVLASASDSDGDPLVATQVSGPSNGNLTLNPDGSFTYTPSTNYSGTDSFQYEAFDGTSYSNPATVTLTINADVPTAANDSYSVLATGTTSVDATDGVLANDSDPDSNSLSAILVTGPSYGNLTLNSDGSFSYTPGTGFTGTDSFTYEAYNGLSYSTPATVSLTTGPVALDQSYGLVHDTVLTVDATDGLLNGAYDADGDPLTAALASAPGDGSVTVNSDGSFTYTPNTGYVGSDSFTYTASDGTQTSAAAAVSLTISNDVPQANPQSWNTPQNTALVVPAATGVLSSAWDDDGDPLTAQLVSGPSYGTLQLGSSGNFTYTPNPDYFGSDSFQYAASDGISTSAPAMVTITVDPVYATASAPRAVATGDFNNDGNPDYVVANYGANTITVFLGNGAFFTQQADVSVGQGPLALVVGNFGNGEQDLAVANSQDGTVSILMNNGSGTFTTSQVITVGSDPNALAVGDFNGDGKLDVAVSNGGSNTVSLLLGSGNGTFTAGSVLTVGSNPDGVAAADFLGNGKMDLAVANAGDGDVGVLLGNGDGTFQSMVTYAVGMLSGQASTGSRHLRSSRW